MLIKRKALLGDPWQRLFSLAFPVRQIWLASNGMRQFRFAFKTAMPPTHPDFPDQPHSLVRLGTGADAAMLDAWFQTLRPLPLLLARGRREMLDSILAHPQRHACFVVSDGAWPSAVLLATLIPHVSEGLTVAEVGEWWEAADLPNIGAVLKECIAALMEWCRAHGIRQVLLAPHIPVDPGLGATRASDGRWQLDLTPTPKRLG